MDKKFLLAVGMAFLLSACAAQSGARTGDDGAIASVEIENGKIVAKDSKGKTVRASQQDILDFIGDKVYFDLDQDLVKGEFDERLELQAALLNTFGDSSYIIEGHADERGTAEYNLALGERRANSSRREIIASGGEAGSIDTSSFGEELPAAFGSNEAAWQQNRRSVTTISGN